MQLALKSKGLRLVMVAAEAAIFLMLSLWISRAYFASVVSHKLSVENLRLAARLDPGDSDYHVQLGRIYQYSLTDIDPTRATDELSRAAQLDPMDAQPWLDLGAAEEVGGQIDQAASCLRRADYLAPHLPGFQWAIANFFLLHGDVSEAVRHFKVVLDGSRNYDSMIFITAWKAIGDGDKILATLIPDNVETQFNYLYFLLGQKKFPEAQKLWTRIAANHESFDPSRAAGYINFLLETRQPDQAYQAWTDLERRGLISESTTPDNLVSNGDFEGEMLNYGFGWRESAVEGVYFGLDPTIFRSGGHSLLITFGGNANLFYEGVYHFVRVEPGVSYQARVFMKTENITTDSGPRLEVQYPFNEGARPEFSDQLTGSNAAWTPLTIRFTPKTDTHFVRLCIARVPSAKLDNLIAGKVWVDDVSLAPVTGAPPGSAQR
ncbi:MAG TPA: hypothetical protein VL523_03060 [Terriglobia bacterium]|nr:hypothetical protein [Terriglobia bacterium]